MGKCGSWDGGKRRGGMRQAERRERLKAGREAVLAQVKEMAEELEAEQFFERLELMIDQIRKDLELIPDPEFREELREVFREVIDYALALKLEPVLESKAM